jgi:hypothetical protein
VQEIALPDSVQAVRARFGFEGVAVVGSGDEEAVYVAFQREWGIGLDGGDPEGFARIGRWTEVDGWAFFHYPLDAVESPAGGWVGLSEIVAQADGSFLVLERDNRSGPSARVKRVYSVSIDGLTPMAQPDGTGPASFPVVTKTLVRDVLPDLQAPNGLVLDKPEGLAVGADGTLYLVTDNDGVDDSSGETQFLRLGAAPGGGGDGAVRLMYSESADRSDPQPLEGASVSGALYIFVDPLTPEGATTASFTLNGSFFHKEYAVPFDFVSGGTDRANESWDSTTASNGENMVGVTIMTGSDPIEASATFTVSN